MLATPFSGKWWWTRVLRLGGASLALSWMVTLKDLFGISPINLDKHPLKDKVKRSWLYRKHGKYEAALAILDEALAEATKEGNQLVISRIFDELANTNYEMGNLDEAERLFRLLIHRLMQLHGKHERDREFIGISLKLSDIFARTGRLDHAETGYRHCVTKQVQVVEETMKQFLISEGAMTQEHCLVEAHGAQYTDPLALLGMCLEAFAHFLVNYREETRMKESQEYMDETLKIYGSSTVHTINLLNNYGAMCNLKNRFSAALKYLAIGIDRIPHLAECADILPGYYCNYAEALFHCGRREEALDYARRAVALAKNAEPRIARYVGEFHRQMLNDYNKKSRTWFFW